VLLMLNMSLSSPRSGSNGVCATSVPAPASAPAAAVTAAAAAGAKGLGGPLLCLFLLRLLLQLALLELALLELLPLALMLLRLLLLLLRLLLPGVGRDSMPWLLRPLGLHECSMCGYMHPKAGPLKWLRSTNTKS